MAPGDKLLGKLGGVDFRIFSDKICLFSELENYQDLKLVVQRRTEIYFELRDAIVRMVR